MAVLGRIVFADDEMGTVGGEVVFVLAAEFFGLVGDVCLLIYTESVGCQGCEEEGEAEGGRWVVPLVLARCWCSTRRRP